MSKRRWLSFRPAPTDPAALTRFVTWLERESDGVPALMADFQTIFRQALDDPHALLADDWRSAAGDLFDRMESAGGRLSTPPCGVPDLERRVRRLGADLRASGREHRAALNALDVHRMRKAADRLRRASEHGNALIAEIGRQVAVAKGGS